MRYKFIGYYTWTPEEFNSLWDRAFFVFDTNTLLNIYRYKEKTCAQFLETLEAIQTKAWIPYQVAEEFHSNRWECITEQEKAYSDLIGALDDAVSTFEVVQKKHSNHKLLQHEELLIEFNESVDKLRKKIQLIQVEHPDYQSSDTVMERVSAIFTGRVGDPIPEEILDSIFTEGEERFEKRIPPGYMDNKKPSPEKFGDLVIWKSIIARAKEEGQPAVFVTSDNKEDWWQRRKGKTIGPRPELIQEFRDETDGQLVYLYNPSPFVEYARKHFGLDAADEEVLNEIEDVRTTRNEFERQVVQNLYKKIGEKILGCELKNDFDRESSLSKWVENNVDKISENWNDRLIINPFIHGDKLSLNDLVEEEMGQNLSKQEALNLIDNLNSKINSISKQIANSENRINNIKKHSVLSHDMKATALEHELEDNKLLYSELNKTRAYLNSIKALFFNKDD